MVDKRLRNKAELKSFFTNLKGKPITDDMISILIDVLWRNRNYMRTFGFRFSGGLDAVISFDIPSRTFTIAPFDPLEPAYIPRFAFFSWSSQADYNERREAETIIIPNQEGLYAIFYATDETTREQTLTTIKNPTEAELSTIYLRRTLISFLYWDADASEVIHFGDDRHGSEWNPQVHTYLHNALGAQKKSGLYFSGMIVNGDGSSNTHAQFSIAGGVMMHDDFELKIASASTMPVLYFFGGLPRFLSNAGYSVYKSLNRLAYNKDMNSLSQCTDGYFVVYHYFATNEISIEARKMISVMGIAQYSSIGAAYINIDAELVQIKAAMPQQGKCYLGSVIYQSSSAYTNTIKARIVGIVGDKVTHPPVSIAIGSEPYLEIDEKQELAFKMEAPVDGKTYGRQNKTWVEIIGGGGTGEDGREVELSTYSGYIVWRYIGETDWNNIISIASLIGPQGTPIELRVNAGWVEWHYVGGSWMQLFEIPTGGSSGVIQAFGTLLAANWVTDGSLKKYVLSNANITATSSVEVIPANASYDILIAAEPLPETESAAGTVTMWCKNTPGANIPVTINITEIA